MSVIILAAGMGTRLRPYTNDIPKCMVSLFGMPMLMTQIQTMKNAGCEDITLVGGYKADKLPGDAVSRITINEEYDTSNMVHTLFCAESFMADNEDLIIAYGDIVYEKPVLDALLQCDGEISLAIDTGWKDLWSLRMENPLMDAETLKLSDEGSVIEIGKKPDSYDEIQGQYMGLIKVRADKVAEFRAFYRDLDKSAFFDGKDFRNMYMTSLIQETIDAGWEVKPAFVTHGWLEVDTAEELESYESLASSGKLDQYFSIERC